MKLKKSGDNKTKLNQTNPNLIKPNSTDIYIREICEVATTK